MPRRSSRPVPAAAAAPDAAPKRRMSARLSEASSTELKRQKYDTTSAHSAQKPIKSTTKKSKYFQDEPSQEPELESKKAAAPTIPDYEDTDISVPTSSDSGSDFAEEASPSSSSADEDGSEEEEYSPEPKRRQSRGKQANGAGSIRQGTNRAEGTADLLSGKELWREGVKTGLGPGKEVFIRKPKARDPGAVAYEDNALHPNTMLFLQDLAENNDRQWLKAHDADYRAAKKDWESFVETLTERIIDQDGTIPELPVKDLVFRIHRDIRFSKNPTPYKTHFSAAWSRTGKKGPYAAYYVHLQPGACFVGSGLWMPEAAGLARLRQDIDHNSHRLKRVLRAPKMRQEIFNGIPDVDEKAVEAFVSHNKESALKVKPKRFLHRLICFHGSAYAAGYDADNENIQLLRLRSFTIGRPLTDEELLSPNAQDRIAALVEIMEPFVSHSKIRLLSACPRLRLLDLSPRINDTRPVHSSLPLVPSLPFFS
ncbi:DUF2461 domain-containing protein [Aspergillus saccharolyticus JOP 1030-1]|uniref:TIGR02453 family protein n=1 Tax=Aspergillus saccharolyticus JOP 1030-1 TaxID=1450539 RepID=A0A318ZLP0_9EURO|nr:hypothetical protein BP01DRAFT_296317 [Aspergillus saccharolyticus JOP 1030-1]PYH45383.1 hypothetical protein BP01DRAFT_296317 [Aspergillus saccharolyticus JOP 1030-1]